MLAKLYTFVLLLACQVTWPAAAQDRRDKRGIAKACRYTNVPWSDCDPTTWLRTKTVKLMEQEQFSNGESCPETREFSQTCDKEELPRGIKQLLEENRTYKLKQNFCHMKLRETKTFMEETQIAVRKINELYKESKSLSSERYSNFTTEKKECATCKSNYKQFQAKHRELKRKHRETEARLISLELENKKLKQQIKIKDKDQKINKEKTQFWKHLNSSESKIEGLNAKMANLENNIGKYKANVKSAVLKRKETMKATSQENYPLSELQKCKEEVGNLKKENSLVGNAKFRCELKLKNLQQHCSTLQERMRSCVTNNNKQKGKNFPENPENVAEKDPSYAQMGNVSSLKTDLLRLQRCNKENEDKLEQLRKMRTELSKLKGTNRSLEGNYLDQTKFSQSFHINSSNTSYLKSNNISLLTESTHKFLEIVEIVKKEIEISHKKEGEYLNLMKLNLTNVLKEQSTYISSIISKLIEENSELKVTSSHLSERVETLTSEKNILQIKFSNFTKYQISEEKYVSCLKEVLSRKKSYQNISLIMVNLKEEITILRASYVFKLLKKFKSYTNLYYLALQKENSLHTKIRNQKQITDELSKNVKTFLSSFQKLLENYFGIKSDFKDAQDDENYKLERLKQDLGNVHKGVRRLYEDFANRIKTEQMKVIEISEKFKKLKNVCVVTENLEERLETALNASEKYKTKLMAEQSNLYGCHGENYNDKKVLRSVASFYTYLLQRLTTLSQGIHHLKVVGSKLRHNLISVHSSLGHCTGNLQGLRHECGGLVSWYQSMPNMEITKRKLLNCQEEMKRKRDDMFGPPVTGDLLARLEEQKALIKKLTEEKSSCNHDRLKLQHLERHMKDYLRVIKTLKQNETSDEKLKVYQHYVDIIHRSFELLRERETILISALRKCHDTGNIQHLHFHYPKAASNHSSSLFPSSARATQRDRKLTDQPDRNISFKDEGNFQIDKIQRFLNSTTEDASDEDIDYVASLGPTESTPEPDFSSPDIDIEKIKSILDETG